jgi:acyl dehydratase
MPKREPRGLYFEDFEIGKTYSTPRRTVTQTDIVNFACLSGDFNAPHVDWEFCREQPGSLAVRGAELRAC